MAFSLDQVYFLDDFCKLNKTPGNGTCLGEPPGGFCDVGCCYFLPHWSLLHLRATFPCHWLLRLLFLASHAREDFYQL